MIEINMSLLNISSDGGLTFMQAQEYVTITSCKAAMSQTTFWMYVYGVLFLASWVLFCYFLFKYLKEKRRNI